MFLTVHIVSFFVLVALWFWAMCLATWRGTEITALKLELEKRDSAIEQFDTDVTNMAATGKTQSETIGRQIDTIRKKCDELVRVKADLDTYQKVSMETYRSLLDSTIANLMLMAEREYLCGDLAEAYAQLDREDLAHRQAEFALSETIDKLHGALKEKCSREYDAKVLPDGTLEISFSLPETAKEPTAAPFQGIFANCGCLMPCGRFTISAD
jgi:hypothetical protein